MILQIFIVFILIALTAVLMNAVEEYNTIHIEFSEETGKIHIPTIVLKGKKEDLLFIVDTGAAVSCINPSSIDKIDHYFIDNQGCDIIDVTGNIFKTDLARGVVSYKGKEINVLFKVFDMGIVKSLETEYGIKVDGLLGSSFLYTNKSLIDYKKKIVHCKNQKK